VIGQVLLWWLASTLIGAIALPLVWRLFGRLPDRGFGFSRALGLLTTGYALWLGVSAGVMKNDLGGTLAAMAVVAGLSVWAITGRWQELKAWLRDNWRTALVIEGLFFVAFVFWAAIRAFNPDIVATEKPMELAFLNSVMLSPSFPPRDPWLAGYGISYYYFGYVIVGMLTRLTGVSTGVAFNLANAMWFALTFIGAYAVVFDLVAHKGIRPLYLLSSLLGPWFVLISGNLEGFLEILHARHIFWQTSANGELTSKFWAWLGLQDLVNAPVAPLSFMPDRYLWWWRASRVVHDVKLSGETVEVIDEFPFFSFLLADNHPHLLALPFVLMAIGFILQVFLSVSPGEVRLGRTKPSSSLIEGTTLVSVIVIMTAALARAIPLIVAGEATGTVLVAVLKIVVIVALGVLLLDNLIMVLIGVLPTFIGKPVFWTAAWILGSLAFLNTWDFPIYLSLMLGVLWWVNRESSFSDVWLPLLSTAAGLGTLGVVFYLPWYPGFTSQAAGILPNIAFPTRLVQLIVMFGTMLIPIVAWLAIRLYRERERISWGTFFGLGLGLPLVLFLLSAGLGFLIVVGSPAVLDESLREIGAVSVSSALPEILKRWYASGSAIVLGLMFAAGVVLLLGRPVPVKRSRGSRPAEVREAWPFAAMMVGIGALLIVGPEFLYLKDTFSTRMNTVFKFYFAAWILWGLASAYIFHELWAGPFGSRTILAAAVSIPLLLGLAYPALAIDTKTNGFQAIGGPTLDGTLHLSREDPEDYAAIQWIKSHLKEGVIAEAVGGSYTQYARISAHTGFPTVLGWEFHEIQWRGTAEPQGSRAADVEHLYETRNPQDALDIIQRYGIDYVYIGPLERSTYRPLVEAKFAAFMDLVYQEGDVSIYALPGEGPS
jgi:YYY domain-containing protein